MAEKAKHAFGSSSNIEQALQSGAIDNFDILFLDGDTDEPKVGWIDKEGNPVIVDTEKVIVVEGDTLPETGEEGKIYIFGKDGYFYDGNEFVNLCKPTDLTELEAEVSKKADAEEVEAKIEKAATDANAYTDEKLEAALGEYLAKKYEISHKPEKTIVNYRDKEIRIMCPADTDWQLQNSGEGSDANLYYIGFKAYAPDNAVSFKEDLQKTITDEEMYYFEGNDFAGVDAQGRKYSIVWLPVAKHDNGVWTYYGVNSSEEKYIGWYYSVEWYNADGVVIASDCIRINLTNEGCHSSIEPYYVSDIMKEVDMKIAEATAIEIVEF